MKSHVDFAIGIYGSIIADATLRWPNLSLELSRDLSRLSRDVEGRGLPFLTIVLPTFGKEFDRALDRGTASGWIIPQGMAQSGNKPKLFSGLLNLVFDDLGVLREDADIEAIAFLKQLYSCLKRLRLKCHPSKVKETLDEYFAIEEHLPRPHEGTWDCEVPTWTDRVGHPIWGPESQSDDGLFPRSKPPSFDYNDLRAFSMRVIKGELGWLPSWDLFPRHGPGATSESTKRVVKYDFEYWPRKLNGVFPFDWFGSGQIDTTYTPKEEELSSRLIAVPKTQKGPRLICAEPVAHQWIQQCIWRWLEERITNSSLLKSVITFRSQVRSQERALASSIDGSLATVDLSSASDRLSCRLVEYVFQGSNILDALHACRTRAMVQTISKDHPSMILLRKFAPMGSACTFPIQTIVFAILSAWSVRSSKGMCGKKITDEDMKDAFSQVTVFGDDIIIPTTALGTLELLLKELGLKVNTNKTFGGLHFRESCGMEAYNGVDVTPAYILEPYDGSPSSMATTIETSNNLHLRGFWKTAAFVVNQLPPKEVRKLLVSQVGEDGALSLRSFVGKSWSPSLRWDRDFQCHYIPHLTVTAEVPMVKGTGLACLTQYFTEVPSPLVKWESGQVGRPVLRKCIGRVYL